MMDGTLETTDGRPALRFERHLASSVERVWRAVSGPALRRRASRRPLTLDPVASS